MNKLKNQYKAIVIGGSAGSFQSILQIIESLPKNFPIPILITIHRLKQVRSGLIESIGNKPNAKIHEPFDKQIIEPNSIYFAPSNYHLLVESDKTISLSTEEAIEFSRPSIDYMFNSAAYVYKHELLAILLSGANKDGANGIETIKHYNGTIIIQNPKEAEVAIMPKAALEKVEANYIFTIQEIIEFINNLF